MGILFALLAAVFGSISNLFLRKSIDSGGQSKGFLVIQLSFSFLILVLLNPVRTQDYTWSSLSFFCGIVGGIILGLLMWGLGKALEKGPAGLSFSFLHASTVLPALAMSIFFGSAYGFHYTLPNAIGSLLVLLGLFWAGRTREKNRQKSSWLIFVTAIFCIHTLLLTFFQWWALALKPARPLSSLLPTLEEVHIQWFMPTVLLFASLIHWILYWRGRSQFPKRAEVRYGILGGLASGGGTFFQILAPQAASNWQNIMIFPIFSVSIILLNNGWAQILYKERVNWWANGLCVAGLLIATLSQIV
jgi:uncharacterized membrane protein